MPLKQIKEGIYMIANISKVVNAKCPKCEFIGTMYRDDDRKNGIKVVACSVCGKRLYEPSGAKIKIKKRTNKKGMAK